MRAGLNDYDDASLSLYTIYNGGEDLSPFDILHQVNKSYVCPIGTCSYYSSINYVLLGLLLTELQNVAAWEDTPATRNPSPQLPLVAFLTEACRRCESRTHLIILKA